MKHKPIIIIIAVLAAVAMWLSFTIPEAEEGYTSYIVKQGETLWSIAQELTDGSDIRAVIFDIKKANGMNSADIFAGDVLMIPNKHMTK